MHFKFDICANIEILLSVQWVTIVSVKLCFPHSQDGDVWAGHQARPGGLWSCLSGPAQTYQKVST